MLARQRQNLILEELRRVGAVRVSELTAMLNVSDMTVRRDLDVLAAAGALEKIHGGATTINPRSIDEPGFEAKSHRQKVEKDLIAAAAALLVSPGSAIGLTAGTTTWALAHHLAKIDNLTVVTNSVQAAEVLYRYSLSAHSAPKNTTVVLIGGMRTPSDALVGPIAVSALKTLHVDQVFMGVHGISELAGFSTPNMMEAETNRAFIESAKKLVVVADRTKWGITGLSTIARLDQAQAIVTNFGWPETAVAAVESNGTQMIMVGHHHENSLMTRVAG